MLLLLAHGHSHEGLDTETPRGRGSNPVVGKKNLITIITLWPQASLWLQTFEYFQP